MQRAVIAVIVMIVMIVMLACGCGGLSAPTPRGVRERAVGVAPIEHVATLATRVPEPGDVRVGVVGSASPERDGVAKAGDGKQTVANFGGELFVAVGMPGAYTSANEQDRAGWEIVGGAIAAAAPKDRAHDVDAMLVAPGRGLAGGYLQINGTIGSEFLVVGASLGVRAMQLPFVWDYGGCAGPGFDCAIWNPKGAVEESSAIAWGISGSIAFWRRMSTDFGWILGAGFDAPPAIETTRVDAVQCDANGQCTGGRKPSAPGAELGGLTGQLMIGGDWRMARWARAFVLFVTSKGGGVWEEHARVGLEATF